MAGLQVPLSTLRPAPRDTLRMTRGQRGLLFLYCRGLSPFTLCAVSRRTGVHKIPFLEFSPIRTKDFCANSIHHLIQRITFRLGDKTDLGASQSFRQVPL